MEWLGRRLHVLSRVLVTEVVFGCIVLLPIVCKAHWAASVRPCA